MQGHNLKDARFSVYELGGAIASAMSITAAVVIWVMLTFQSKDEATEVKQELTRRIDSVEHRVNTLQLSLDGVAKDVSYIRGRLEPKSN